MLKCALRMLQPSIVDCCADFKTEEDRGMIEEDRGRSRKIEEDRGRSRKIEEIEEDRGRSRKIEEDRGRSRKIEEDRGKDRGRSRKDRGRSRKIEEDRGRSRKIEENAISGISRFWAVFPTMIFFGFFGQMTCMSAACSRAL